MRLQGETALVTGSSGGGLGAEIARLFAREGASIMITGRSKDRGAALAGELRAAGYRAAFKSADLSVRADCTRLVAATATELGGPSILVNCAVSLRTPDDGPVGTVGDEIWDEMFRTNTTAAMWLCQEVVPLMTAAGRGSIVNVTSRTALRGTPDLAAYSASKAALEGLTRSIAMDYSRAGVRCNAVAPGYITGKERVGELDPRTRERFEAMHLTRMPTTQDVANAVLFLASDEAGAITGVTLPVDGGGSAVRGLTLG
ncbi:SDR family NAD(P)-dependent oxidoreductase [Spirillospora sp. NPDC048819]|uniref:SDR family NAD(P)-dependent oxidoreductase n=1 Tax=Spirillospora sp. NPDC048819 TaxID=3155268 RepID=UPI003410D542